MLSQSRIIHVVGANFWGQNLNLCFLNGFLHLWVQYVCRNSIRMKRLIWCHPGWYDADLDHRHDPAPILFHVGGVGAFGFLYTASYSWNFALDELNVERVETLEGCRSKERCDCVLPQPGPAPQSGGKPSMRRSIPIILTILSLSPQLLPRYLSFCP